jgi:hypothetical protein
MWAAIPMLRVYSKGYWRSGEFALDSFPVCFTSSAMFSYRLLKDKKFARPALLLAALRY